MHRIHVDLPEPDGPITTTTSCSPTSVVTPRRAWKSPNHFFTPSQTMIGSLPLPVICCLSYLMPTPRRRSRRRLARLNVNVNTQYTTAANTRFSSLVPSESG